MHNGHTQIDEAIENVVIEFHIQEVWTSGHFCFANPDNATLHDAIKDQKDGERGEDGFIDQ
jgi:hypothetical protein